ATATLIKADRNMAMQARDLSLSLKRDREGAVTILTSAQVSYGQNQSPIKAQLLLVKDQPVNAEASFSDIMPSDLAGLFGDNPAIPGIQLPISGTVGVSVDQEGHVQRANFDIKGGKGTVHYEKIDGDLNVSS